MNSVLRRSCLPEDEDDREVLKEAIHFAMTGDLDFHRRMGVALDAAGFDVLTVQQHWFHHIYEVRMKRGSFDLDRDDRQAARQVRRVLKRAKFHIERDSLNVTQYSDRVRLVFIYPFGAEGTLRVGR